MDKSDGDVRKVQKLSRHKNRNTLMIYDDNRNNDQLELSELLEEDL
ncbi:integrase-recombinase protein [Crocosphaera watsonii WH 8501]|uniref:Integrase-recombinase protein n=1 Tax=Crocosphaera watsonii WH 8501 TaxID=165597 RepID=Q4BV25_CROWT|nr:integrase-recombinase protein [Crocosphaera watsonii WH 8501]